MAAGAVYDEGNVRLEIVRSARDTGGAFLEMAATYAPGSRPPPLHHHPVQEETFTIRRGALRFVVGRDARVVSAGDEIVVRPMTNHKAWNASATEAALVTWITRPALRTEEFFAVMYDLRQRRGGVLPMALVLRAHRREFALARVPGPVQTCVFGLLAPIARAFGHRLPDVAD